MGASDRIFTRMLQVYIFKGGKGREKGGEGEEG